MRSVRSLLRGRGPEDQVVIDVAANSRRLLTEYVLNLAVSALSREDITPIYEQYIGDPRLLDEERDELARAFLLFQMATTVTATNP